MLIEYKNIAHYDKLVRFTCVYCGAQYEEIAPTNLSCLIEVPDKCRTCKQSKYTVMIINVMKKEV